MLLHGLLEDGIGHVGAVQAPGHVLVDLVEQGDIDRAILVRPYGQAPV